MTAPRGRVLIVAGSDSGGGAGIQADIKTVTALGGYAMTAVTALTAQNTLGVQGILDVPPKFIAQQMRLVLDDIGADAVKTGMLHRASVIAAVAGVLEEYHTIPLVLDPVMVAKGGAALLEEDAMAALKRFLPRAFIITPNIPEAELLTGTEIRSLDDMKRAAEALRRMGPQAVLVKGGHLEGAALYDVYLDDDGMQRFESARIDTPHTHGTGCTLASAIATGLAQGLAPYKAVARARAYVREAILAAPGFGHGHGPLHHGWTVKTDGLP
ncbi:MAG: bifunctional hydroxymethylpyrimidine kinase/phosphomethylpyrimidine kinase [Alphaproteobacteria bacterium]|nr:bifunctional hydroxymethylpyrimidine kinase/phosphomethylpyrimidine kinase [Alphaproteobacteria bacterium]